MCSFELRFHRRHLHHRHPFASKFLCSSTTRKVIVFPPLTSKKLPSIASLHPLGKRCDEDDDGVLILFASSIKLWMHAAKKKKKKLPAPKCNSRFDSLHTWCTSNGFANDSHVCGVPGCNLQGV